MLNRSNSNCFLGWPAKRNWPGEPATTRTRQVVQDGWVETARNQRQSGTIGSNKVAGIASMPLRGLAIRYDESAGLTLCPKLKTNDRGVAEITPSHGEA